MESYIIKLYTVGVDLRTNSSNKGPSKSSAEIASLNTLTLTRRRGGGGGEDGKCLR